MLPSPRGDRDLGRLVDDPVLEVRRDGDLRQLVLRAGHLRRPAATPLALEHLAVEQELPAPHTPRLAPLEGALEALGHHGAERADLLRLGDVLELLAEEQAAHGAGEVVAAGLGPPVSVLGGLQPAGTLELVLVALGQHRPSPFSGWLLGGWSGGWSWVGGDRDPGPENGK